MAAIIDILKGIVEETGMNFACGFQKGIAEKRLELPVVWAEIPVLTGKNGNRQGTLQHRIKIHIAEVNRGYSEEEKERVWERLEGYAIEIYDRLYARDGVKNVKNLTCTPTETKITGYGEVSVTATFETETLFCKKAGCECPNR